MKRGMIVTVSIIVLALLLVAIPLVSANEPEPATTSGGGVFIVGKVIEAEEDQLLVDVSGETWVVSVGEDTVIRLPGIPDATMEDIQVDKGVMVRGEVTAPSAMTAQTITARGKSPSGGNNALQVLRQALQLRGTQRGEVTDVGKDQFTMQVGKEGIVIHVDEDTVYRIADIEEPTFADIEVGQLVIVQVSKDEDATAKGVAVVTQRQMRRANASQQFLRGTQRALGVIGLRGEVISVDEGVLVISTPKGEATINVDDETRLRIGGEDEASLAEVQVGDIVVVLGRPNLACPIDATGIQVMPKTPAD